MSPQTPVPLRWFLRSMLVCAAFAVQFSSIPRTTNESFALLEFGVQKMEAQVTRAAALPRRLQIPGIELDTSIVPVGLLPGGQLDVPSDALQVGWYNLNTLPGGIGNAILDGHLDLDGKPGAFWRLRRVRKGDEILVTDDRGKTRRFRVRRTEVYPVDQAPMAEIFGATSGRHLNLITCAGVWRKELNHYDKRLVVFTDLVTEK